MKTTLYVTKAKMDRNITDRQCRAKVMVATEVDFQGNGGFSVLQQLKPEYWLEDWDGVKSASARNLYEGTPLSWRDSV